MRKNMFDNLSAIVSNTLTDSIQMIDIDELHESADNFFVVENIEQFAHTILGQGGVKDNLIVRPLETGGYEVISGHRRRAAVQYLIDNGENISHFLPCLVQNYADEDEKMLDLILMNVTARQISDPELWKCYETIDRILKDKKEKGEYFGRLRDDIAKTLGVSSAQVGKMQNVEKYAIDTVKEAVASGELSISTANEIAKLSPEEQENIPDLSKIQPKDIKKKAKKETKLAENVDTNINDDDSELAEDVDTNIDDDDSKLAENVDTNINDDDSELAEDVDTNINDDDSELAEDVDTNINDNDSELAESVDTNINKKKVELMNWATTLSKEQTEYLFNSGMYNQAIKGYLLLAAEEAELTNEQTKALLGGIMKVISNLDKEQAENKYLNY